MAKLKEVFVCQNCGASSPKWQGQCAGCGEWNTLVAELQPAGSAARPGGAGERSAARPVSTSLAAEASAEQPRLATGSAELDRVLGGGLVAGSVTLIGGDPGHRQIDPDAAGGRGARLRPARSLYATGEESLKQVALAGAASGARRPRPRGWSPRPRSRRSWGRRASLKARALIVDSIQTMYSERIDAAPGAVSQLRECTAELVRFAKSSGTAVLLVGHVTKEGQIAGPRVLEHMVDTVLYFESDTGSRFRVLRSVKNRFGAANEIGVFAMAGAGPARSHQSIGDFPLAPCRAGVGQRHHRDARGHPLAADRSSGAGRCAAWARTRAALRSASTAIGSPCCWRWRTATRGSRCQGQDVFANVVGGVRLQETAGDLAIVLAARSSLHDMPLAASR